MTEAVDQAPVTAVDAPEVAAVAGILRQLWPEMGSQTALRHARTVVRVNEKYYGPADLAAAQRLMVTQSGSRPEEVPEDACIEIPRQPGLFLRKWTPEMDRRPRVALSRVVDPAWQPGGAQYQANYRSGRLYLGSARHGECTHCIKANRLAQAVYRVGDDRDSYSRSSVCAPCARKMIGGPVVVPTFSSPEEAQAWLDANGD